MAISELVVKVSGDISDLDKELGRGVNAVNKASDKMETSFDKVASASKKVAGNFAKMGAAAVVAAVAIGTKLVTSTLNSVDAQAKFADRIGISIEALASMQLAAELTGVSTSNLNLGLQRMTRRVSEAAKGSGTAVAALKELGLEAKTLNDLSPDKQFEAIAGAMEKVTSQADRVRLAMRLFDTEGVALVNTLKLGEEGLKEIRKQADAFGLTISRIDASRIEEVNDRFTELSAATTGFGKQLTLSLVGVLESAAKASTEVLENLTAIFKEANAASTPEFLNKKTLGDAQRELSRVRTEGFKLKESLRQVIEINESLGKSTSQDFRSLKRQIQANKELAENKSRWYR